MLDVLLLRLRGARSERRVSGSILRGSDLSGLTQVGSLLCSRALVTEWFLAQRESGYRLAGYELD